MNAALAPAAVVVRRTIAASAEQLFDAWLDPISLSQWMRPGTIRSTVAHVDARVGGSYEIVMHADSVPIVHTGVYRVIDRPKRLAFTWQSVHTGPGETLVTVDFVRLDKRTEVIVTHEQLPESASQSHQRLDGRPRALAGGMHVNNIRVTTFRWVPPFAQGLVRDLCVRWALEEAGLPYEQKLLGLGEQKSPAHQAVQPFGQVPAYEEGALTLFESGSIVMHIARKSKVLMPGDEAGRARTLTWVMAALSSVEPHVQNLASIDFFFANEEWAKLRRPGAEAMARGRLMDVSKWLGEREYLEDRFTAGDLMMSTVLRIVGHTPLLSELPNLAAYQARCEARPAFKRALDSQLANFAKYAPAA